MLRRQPSPESYGGSLSVFTWGMTCSGLNFKEIILVAELRRGQGGRGVQMCLQEARGKVLLRDRRQCGQG